MGKTTLARRLAAETPTELVHLDHLLHAVCSVAGPEALAALRKAPSINAHTPPQWLEELRARDQVLWKAARAYVTAANGQPLVVEGGLWPDWVRELDEDHVAIFIVDTGDSAERLVEITHTNPQSWMAQRQWPDDKIRRWAGYNRFRSSVIADLAYRYDYPVFDIAGGIGLAHDQALDHLRRSPMSVWAAKMAAGKDPTMGRNSRNEVGQRAVGDRGRRDDRQ